jgi:hypothetical protein
MNFALLSFGNSEIMPALTFDCAADSRLGLLTLD